MDNNLPWYLDQIKSELENIDSEYVGNVKFQANIFKGGISNVNVTTEKSIKKPEKKRLDNKNVV